MINMQTQNKDILIHTEMTKMTKVTKMTIMIGMMLNEWLHFTRKENSTAEIQKSNCIFYVNYKTDKRAWAINDYIVEHIWRKTLYYSWFSYFVWFSFLSSFVMYIVFHLQFLFVLLIFTSICGISSVFCVFQCNVGSFCHCLQTVVLFKIIFIKSVFFI